MLITSIQTASPMNVIVKIVLLCALSFCANASLLQKQGQSSDRMNIGKLLKAIPSKVSFRDVRTISSRLPRAIGRTIKLSTKSFITSSAVLFPVGLVLNINRLRPIDAWLMRGAAMGLEWAKVGAYFAGAEMFFATMRNKDDRLNAYLGSGVTSGLLRFHEGPVGMVQGFAIGYGFMYAIDKFVVQDSHLMNSKLKFPAATDSSSSGKDAGGAAAGKRPAAASSSSPSTAPNAPSGREGSTSAGGMKSFSSALPALPKWK